MKTIPLSPLEADPIGTLNACADSGRAVVVELPDRRLIALAPLDSKDEDTLVDDLLATNAAFQNLVKKSKASGKKLFRPKTLTRAKR